MNILQFIESIDSNTFEVIDLENEFILYNRNFIPFKDFPEKQLLKVVMKFMKCNKIVKIDFKDKEVKFRRNLI